MFQDGYTSITEPIRLKINSVYIVGPIMRKICWIFYSLGVLTIYTIFIFDDMIVQTNVWMLKM